MKNGRTGAEGAFPDRVRRGNRHAPSVKTPVQGSHEVQARRKNQHNAFAAQTACRQCRRNGSGICIQVCECSLISDLTSMVEEHKGELVCLAYCTTSKH